MVQFRRVDRAWRTRLATLLRKEQDLLFLLVWHDRFLSAPRQSISFCSALRSFATTVATGTPACTSLGHQKARRTHGDFVRFTTIDKQLKNQHNKFTKQSTTVPWNGKRKESFFDNICIYWIWPQPPYQWLQSCQYKRNLFSPIC